MTPRRYRRIRHVLDRRQPDLSLISENVHKTHNFSALLRTCDAVGVWEALSIVPDGDLRISRPVSGNVGHWVKTRVFDRTSQAISYARGQGMQVLAAHLAPEAVDYRRPDYTRPTAILVGQEKEGVTDEAARGCDGFIMIPMAGMGASLNVSVAAAVILYEVQRQRQAAGLYDRPRLDRETYRKTLFEWGYPRLEEYCRREGVPYPELDEEGRVIGNFPPRLVPGRDLD